MWLLIQPAADTPTLSPSTVIDLAILNLHAAGLCSGGLQKCPSQVPAYLLPSTEPICIVIDYQAATMPSGCMPVMQLRGLLSAGPLI
jgi:hypothetical protein